MISSGSDGIPPILLKELAEEICFPPCEHFSDFTGIWTAAKGLANSQRIANLQRGSAYKSEKLLASELNKHVF